MAQNTISHLYEINTRIWIETLSEHYGRKIDLASVPEDELAWFKEWGFDAVWRLGVWAPSKKGTSIARSEKNLLKEIKAVFPDVSASDIGCSPYSIAQYDINPSIGNAKSILDFKQRLNRYHIKLILDFVPNHLALDHPWVKKTPSFFINGNKKDLKERPAIFFSPDKGRHTIAYGKDPYFLAWKDVAQLNYFNPATRTAMADELMKVASLCDGVRCDMAMLILKNIQKQVWGKRVFFNKKFKEPRTEFWQEAIPKIKERLPDFIFIAEVYWRLEDTLVSMGFDYCYDKAFYDALQWNDVEKIKDAFRQSPGAAKRLRFIENHDEGRAVSVFGSERAKAAALLLMLSGGAHLIHQGQFEGFKKRMPIQLLKPIEGKMDEDVAQFYDTLYSIISSPLVVNGQGWSVIEPNEAWDRNITNKNFIALFNKSNYCLIVVNYASFNSQCYLHLDIADKDYSQLFFKDVFGGHEYIREKKEFLTKGLYLDMPAYGFHVFIISPL